LSLWEAQGYFKAGAKWGKFVDGTQKTGNKENL
jgi:hypothetical protein